MEVLSLQSARTAPRQLRCPSELPLWKFRSSGPVLRPNWKTQLSYLVARVSHLEADSDVIDVLTAVIEEPQAFLTMASIQASHILLFGATGFIGQHITHEILRAQPAFQQVTIFTSKETAENKSQLLEGWKKAHKVQVVTGSVDSETDVRAAYKEHLIDTVVCAFGRGAIAKQIQLIKWGDEEGVRWFFPSEYGTGM